MAHFNNIFAFFGLSCCCSDLTLFFLVHPVSALKLHKQIRVDLSVISITAICTIDKKNSTYIKGFYFKTSNSSPHMTSGKPNYTHFGHSRYNTEMERNK